MDTINNLKNRSDQVRLETVEDANSASRVGALIKDVVDTLDANKVEKAAGYSMMLVSEINRLRTVVNQTLAGLNGVEKKTGYSLMSNAEILRLSSVFNQTLAGLNGVVKEHGKSLMLDTEIERLAHVTNQTLADLNGVEKEYGKSLMANTEMIRLKSVFNQTLFGLGGEPTINKKSILNPTSTKEFPNSKGVADYISNSLFANVISLEIKDDLCLWFKTPDIYSGFTFDISNGNLIVTV